MVSYVYTYIYVYIYTHIQGRIVSLRRDDGRSPESGPVRALCRSASHVADCPPRQHRPQAVVVRVVLVVLVDTLEIVAIAVAVAVGGAVVVAAVVAAVVMVAVALKAVGCLVWPSCLYLLTI